VTDSGAANETEEQLALPSLAPRRRRPAAVEGLAETDPVAEVAVDVPLAHLDRPFEYAVPANFSGTA
jgi:primosomal protein N' (replication factor Y)